MHVKLKYFPLASYLFNHKEPVTCESRAHITYNPTAGTQYIDHLSTLRYHFNSNVTFFSVNITNMCGIYNMLHFTLDINNLETARAMITNTNTYNKRCTNFNLRHNNKAVFDVCGTIYFTVPGLLTVSLMARSRETLNLPPDYSKIIDYNNN